VGNTIGAGILRAPGDVAARLPSTWAFLLVWVIGGFYALLGANALAELGTMIPRSGGQYVFSHRAFGPFAGFIVGWSDWLSTCGSTAAVALVIGEYSRALFPAVRGAEGVIAGSVVLAFAFMQSKGIREGSAIQLWTSLLKAIAFIFLILACFLLGGGTAGREVSTIATPSLALAGWIIALQGVIYTYDGWSGVIYFSEEVTEPGQDIPRSIFGGVLTVTAIYLLLNVAFLYVVPLTALAGQSLAAGVVAERLFGPFGEPILSVLTIVSLLSAVNAFQLMAPRVLLAMSADGLVTRRALQVNAGGTPVIALWASTAIAILYIFSGNFGDVVAVLSFFFVANYALSFSALFLLRRKEPDLARPFRAKGHPWTTGAALIASVAFLIGSIVSDPRNGAIAVALLVISYPIFRYFREPDKTKKSF